MILTCFYELKESLLWLCLVNKRWVHLCKKGDRIWSAVTFSIFSTSFMMHDIVMVQKSYSIYIPDICMPHMPIFFCASMIFLYYLEFFLWQQFNLWSTFFSEAIIVADTFQENPFVFKTVLCPIFILWKQSPFTKPFQATSAEGPCFHKMKNTVKKMNGF